MEEAMRIINTVNPDEIETYVGGLSPPQPPWFAPDVNCYAYSVPTQTTSFQLMTTKTHTVCTITNLTDLNIFPGITTYSWVGKFPLLHKAPVALGSQKTAVIRHYHDQAGAGAAGFVSGSLEDDHLSFLLAWDNPTDGPKRCYAEVNAIKEEDDDEPDWEKLKHKLSLSSDSATLVNKALGYACKVQAKQVNTKSGTLIHVATTFYQTN